MERLVFPMIVFISLIAFSCSDEIKIPVNPPYNCFPRSDYDMVDWAGDGRHVVFVFGGNSEGTDTAGIFIYDLEDSTTRLLVEGDLLVGAPLPLHPSFSPDSRWVVFSWYDEIWKVKVDGDSLTQLTFSDEGGKYFPSWSPDGSKILYTNVNIKYGNIWIMNADGSGKRQFYPPM